MEQRFRKIYALPAIILLIVFTLNLLGQGGISSIVEYVLTFGAVMILLAVYCLGFHHKKVAGNIVYFVATGWLLALELYYDVLPMLGGDFSIHVVTNLCFMLGVVFMILMKIKPHLGFAIPGAVLFWLSGAIWSMSFTEHLLQMLKFSYMETSDLIEILRVSRVMMGLLLQNIAYTLIIFFELVNKPRKSRSLEEDLNYLQAQYNNMEITALEYEERKAVLLEKL